MEQQRWTGSGYKTGPDQQQQQAGGGQEQNGTQNGAAMQQQNIEQQQQQQQQERTYNEVEQLAMKMGWNPEHDSASGREFKTAEQFILDGKEYQDTTVKTLNTLKKQNEELTAGMHHLRETHKRSLEVERRRVDEQIAQLKSKRDQAIDNSDKDAVNRLDTEIQTLESDKRDIEQAAQQPTSTAGGGGDFKELSKQWMADNPWYGTDQVMSDYVDTQSDRFRGLPNEMYFKRLTQSVQAMFPDKFPNQQTGGQQQQQNQQQQNQQQQQTVVGGQTRQTGGGQQKTFTFDDLSSEQKKAALFFERTKVMSRQEYVDEQAKIGGIPGQQ